MTNLRREKIGRAQRREDGVFRDPRIELGFQRRPEFELAFAIRCRRSRAFADAALRHEAIDDAIKRFAVIEVRTDECPHPVDMVRREVRRQLHGCLTIARIDQHQIVGIDVAPVGRIGCRRRGRCGTYRLRNGDQGSKANRDSDFHERFPLTHDA